jgi:Rap1a immunity proteins
MKSILLGALTALTITTADAAEVDRDSANSMLPYCQLKDALLANTTNAFLGGRCAGIIYTVDYMFGALKVEQERGKLQLNSSWCVDTPNGVTMQQLTNVIAKWAGAHPEHTHEPFLGIAMIALHDAWPCKN